MKITDYNIVYINLDKRKDRNKIFKNQFKNIKTKRISAINGLKLTNKEYREKISNELNIPIDKLIPTFWSNRSNFKSMNKKLEQILPKVGCYLSHLKAIQYAIQKKWSNILILEDDAKTLPNTFSKDFNLPKKCDITYFGGLFWHLEKHNKNINKWIKINPHKLKLLGTFAYGLNNKNVIMDIYNVMRSVFIDSVKSFDKHVDWRSGNIKMRAQSIDFFYTNYFQKYGICYVKNPVLFTHIENDHSDISPFYGTTTKRWKHNYNYND